MLGRVEGARDATARSYFFYGSLSAPRASVVLIAAEAEWIGPQGPIDRRLGRGPGPLLFSRRVPPVPSDRVFLSRPPGPGMRSRRGHRSRPTLTTPRESVPRRTKLGLPRTKFYWMSIRQGRGVPAVPLILIGL